MSGLAKYFIVEASAMPEIYRKVAQAKNLLETGEATTVNAAARAVGISRSAFYKYRDAVMPFRNMMTGRIITIQLLIHDKVGLLSSILDVFAAIPVCLIAYYLCFYKKALPRVTADIRTTP